MADTHSAITPQDMHAQTYLVGGGIASLAAAVFMIRDAGVDGSAITILEEKAVFGGSLDGAGSAECGYVARGGRMLESKYLCTFDLLAAIPTLDGTTTVAAEIIEWNRILQTSSSSRLIRDGRAQTAPEFGLSERDIVTIERLLIEPEFLLGRRTIADEFGAAFFHTDFWIIWCTTFAFQPWHSAAEFRRYLDRFAHMIDGFERLRGIMRTVYNQYDSLVRPLQAWLHAHGVHFEHSSRVTDLRVAEVDGLNAVTAIELEHNGISGAILVQPGDNVLVTLGSMTEASSFGTTETPPELDWRKDGPAWALWKRIAHDRPEFGHPWRFSEHVDQSKWVSFTATMHDPALLGLIETITGNVPGEGGLVSFPNSNWLLSMVVPHQPHFIGQPAGVSVCWGYGLSVDEPGNFVPKPMSSCSGREIMTELLGHLHVAAEAPAILSDCICIPCMMPFVTSQFLPREPGDRPQVVPQGWRNLAFLGQFCELPEDVVFTVEYSVRSAQTAVHRLFGRGHAPPSVYQGKYDIRVLYDAFRAIHDIRSHAETVTA
jgi:oleate hydratase